MDDLIEGWQARLHAVAAEAVAYLATLDRSPVPDGVLGDWIDTLCALRFEATDVAPIAALIAKDEPLLQEAGVQLARAALRNVDAATTFTAAIARRIEHGVDPWVLEAIVDLLERGGHRFDALYPTLVRLHGTSPRGPGIMRNRGINPWGRLESFYAQCALQTMRPTPNDLAYLPMLEARHRTRGWKPTVTAILVGMGLDPKRHFALLDGR